RHVSFPQNTFLAKTSSQNSEKQKKTRGHWVSLRFSTGYSIHNILGISAPALSARLAGKKSNIRHLNRRTWAPFANSGGYSRTPILNPVLVAICSRTLGGTKTKNPSLAQNYNNTKEILKSVGAICTLPILDPFRLQTTASSAARCCCGAEPTTPLPRARLP
ncbi:unnamed protein product, partial [Ectocarpus sp. 8 AP-2014]